jgi:hypothetical protein
VSRDILRKQRREAESVIFSAGQLAEVFRVDATATNRYGTPVESHARIGEASVVRYFGRRSHRAGEVTTEYGRFTEESPRLMFARSVDIREDDELSFPDDGRDDRLRVQSLTHFPTHTEGYGQYVTES